MTIPVTADDIVQGAVKWLLGFTDVLTVLGTFPGTAVPWLFQQKLWITVEGTQSTAALIRNAGGWAGPNRHNTARFPRLALEIYADPIRDTTNNITDPGETARRLVAAYKVFDTHLHRPQGGVQMWGDVRISDSIRLGEYTIFPIDDGVQQLQVFYGVTEG